MNKGRRQNSNPRSPTGFGKPCDVPSTLRSLLKLEDDEFVTIDVPEHKPDEI